MTWWRRDPWRGMKWRERRRLWKLGQRGERIVDPQDAKLVRDYMEYWEWFLRSLIARVILGFVVLWLSLTALSVVVRAFRGESLIPVRNAVWGGIFTLALA